MHQLGPISTSLALKDARRASLAKSYTLVTHAYILGVFTVFLAGGNHHASGHIQCVIQFWPTLDTPDADLHHEHAGLARTVYTLYMTVCLVISLAKLQYIHDIHDIKYTYIWF
jgi:hypothetical protein